MTMPEMRKAISNLRLMLASIKSKEDELESQRRQFKRQLDRSPYNAIHGGTTLDASLGIMQEIQERLDHVENNWKHLMAIKKRAQDELRALELTDKIEQAKADLASIRARRKAGEHNEEVNQERIEELERFIEEASLQAGQAITDDFDLRSL